MRPFHVHGTDVLEVDRRARPGASRPTAARRPSAGLPLVALGADCAPIALANDTAVAAIHAGWRGALDGVVEAGVAAVRRLGRGPVRAAIGPCICVRHYEFGADALAPLVARFGDVGGRARRPTARPAFDLPRALHLALRRRRRRRDHRHAVLHLRVADHFSYRRDHRTGRQAVVVVKEA